jgi:hypothetical protein
MPPWRLHDLPYTLILHERPNTDALACVVGCYQWRVRDLPNAASATTRTRTSTGASIFNRVDQTTILRVMMALIPIVETKDHNHTQIVTRLLT